MPLLAGIRRPVLSPLTGSVLLARFLFHVAEGNKKIPAARCLFLDQRFSVSKHYRGENVKKENANMLIARANQESDDSGDQTSPLNERKRNNLISNAKSYQLRFVNRTVGVAAAFLSGRFWQCRCVS